MLLVHNCCVLAKGLSVYFDDSAKVSMHKPDFLFVINLRYDLSYIYNIQFLIPGLAPNKSFKSVVLLLKTELT